MTSKKKPARRFEMQFDVADEATFERLEKLARKSRRSKAEVVRLLIRRANVADVS